ncbi:MAG TPA: Crp/Fnr family transcriptional regulator [Flavobacteriaceae bacterium]|nr:Crp/Fnr family transcriptional regulator [Flavobacteriaceae bacterium]
MPSISFQQYLINNLAIENIHLEEIADDLKTISVKKNDFLLKAGAYCKETFFVDKGLLRQFSVDEKGKEHILSFASENWFLTNRDSSYFDLPSPYYIQALEDSEVTVINEDFLKTLTENFPSFTDFNTKLLHSHIRQLQKRINLLLSASAEDRYLNFIKMYPDILQRVPQSMIASFLGITPESLSRVRRDLVLK